MKIKEDLIRSLMADRTRLNKKLASWNDKNMANPQLENQLSNIDMRIDYLLTTMGGDE